jgi:hypothetical protein
MIYSIFCTLAGKTISTAHGDYADDTAAIEKARWYLRSSAADTIRVHRDAPFYPLGEMIAELHADRPDPENSAANLNTVMHGNCVDIMSRMQSRTVDFVITDPPLYHALLRPRRSHRRERRQRALAQTGFRTDAPPFKIGRVLRELLRLEQGGSLHRRVALGRFPHRRASCFPQEVRIIEPLSPVPA